MWTNDTLADLKLRCKCYIKSIVIIIIMIIIKQGKKDKGWDGSGSSMLEDSWPVQEMFQETSGSGVFLRKSIQQPKNQSRVFLFTES